MKIKPSVIQQESNQRINNTNILFFDLDSTLVDTDYANFLSYKKAIKLVKKTDFDIAYNPTQRFNRHTLKSVILNITEAELEMIIDEKERYYNNFLHETQLKNEIADILYKYSKTNKTVLVTNCRKDRALATLNYHGLTDKFSDLFFREYDDDLKINKFQKVISVLGISPELVIVFENECDEIAGAMKAGIQHINPLII